MYVCMYEMQSPFTYCYGVLFCVCTKFLWERVSLSYIYIYIYTHTHTYIHRHSQRSHMIKHMHTHRKHAYRHTHTHIHTNHTYTHKPACTHKHIYTHDKHTQTDHARTRKTYIHAYLAASNQHYLYIHTCGHTHALRVRIKSTYACIHTYTPWRHQTSITCTYTHAGTHMH
jgi:hypothetical protein